MLKSYDPKCAELARHFLGEDAKPEFVAVLAASIQEAVEDWFSTAERLSVALDERKPPLAERIEAHEDCYQYGMRP